MKKLFMVIIIVILISGCSSKKSYSCTYKTSNTILDKNVSIIDFAYKNNKLDTFTIKDSIEYNKNYHSMLDDEFYTLLDNDYKLKYGDEGMSYKLDRTEMGANVKIDFDLDKMNDKSVTILNSKDKVNIDISLSKLIKLLKEKKYVCK